MSVVRDSLPSVRVAAPWCARVLPLQSPARMPAHWACLLVGGGLWGILLLSSFAVDGIVTGWIAEAIQPDTYVRRAVKLPAHLFNWESFLLLGVALALHPRRRTLLRAYVATIVATLVILHLAKFVIGRVRPDLECGPYYLCPFGDPRLGFDSFPSGHATLAVLLTLLAALYLRRSWVVLLPLAILTCVGRVALQRHFVSDVLAGAGLACLMVYLAVRIFGREAFPTLRLSSYRAMLPRRRPPWPAPA